MLLKYFTRFLLLSLIAILGLVIGAHTASHQDSHLSDQCIMCHVENYNASLQQGNIHPPFFARQCTVCHMPEGSETLALSASESTALLTGVAVTQEPLWRKQQVFGGDLLAVQHQVTLSGLDAGAVYRFRLMASEQKSSTAAGSLWLGLNPGEFMPGESKIITLSDERSGNIEIEIGPLVFTALSPETLLVSWNTERLVYSQLELQKLEGQDLPTEGSVTMDADQSDQHPRLRSPAESAINACYQCHSEADLGTSHPVRLYSGRDVQIPDELPTVDGMLTCVTCHDPHGAEGEMLVREIIKTKLCVTCHYKFKNSSPSTMFQ